MPVDQRRRTTGRPSPAFSSVTVLCRASTRTAPCFLSDRALEGRLRNFRYVDPRGARARRAERHLSEVVAARDHLGLALVGSPHVEHIAKLPRPRRRRVGRRLPAKVRAAPSPAPRRRASAPRRAELEQRDHVPRTSAGRAEGPRPPPAQSSAAAASARARHVASRSAVATTCETPSRTPTGTGPPRRAVAQRLPRPTAASVSAPGPGRARP